MSIFVVSVVLLFLLLLIALLGVLLHREDRRSERALAAFKLLLEFALQVVREVLRFLAPAGRRRAARESVSDQPPDSGGAVPPGGLS